MADLNAPRHDADLHVEEDYATWEIVLWLVGILAIPGVPILMNVFFTPWSGL